VVKAEWGTKRTCQDCGARFYDLRRDPIICPKCETVHEPEPAPKPRARRAPAAEKAPEIPKKTPDEATPPAGEIEAVDEDEKNEGKDIIEDPSELGEDEDDIAEVIVVIEEKKGEGEP
jgi:uncharacterized protein (TIGR02300 family)